MDGQKETKVQMVGGKYRRMEKGMEGWRNGEIDGWWTEVDDIPEKEGGRDEGGGEEGGRWDGGTGVKKQREQKKQSCQNEMNESLNSLQSGPKAS